MNKELPPAGCRSRSLARLAAPVEAEGEGDGMPTMVGHFATFGDWYEVDSVLEGHFLESIDRAPSRRPSPRTATA